MDYHFRPLGKTCAATGVPLPPGAKIVSVLVDREGDLQRLDYLAEEWTAPPPGTVGTWQCAVPAAPESSSRPLDPDALLAFFEQLTEDANPAQEQLAYVVALLLLQKRRLRLEDSRDDGAAQYLQLVGSRGEGPYEVRDLKLEDAEIVRLQRELSHCLTEEWNAA
jgi:hypothetical protein